jgi:hypothetical protein
LDQHSLSRQLIALLERLGEQQRDVLSLLEQQHNAMVARDLTNLSEIARSLVQRATQLQTLERERSKVSGQLAAALGADDPALSLRDIAARLDDSGLADLLLQLRDELVATQQRLTEARDRNQQLAANVLDANDATLRNLMAALREAGFGPDDTPRVLDRRA